MRHILRQLGTRLPRGAALAVAGAGLAAGSALLANSASLAAAASAAPPTAALPLQPWHREDAKALPTFTKAEVAKHVTLDEGVWVIFRGAVYDITPFVQNHPGGVEKILTAAGQSVEPFWSLYRQHVQLAGEASGPVPKEHVGEILAPLQVGWLDPAEAAAAAAVRSADDPYRDEPERHPALRMLSETPCSAETPNHLLGDAYLTPNDLWYVRNHHPVPRLSGEGFTLEVCGSAGDGAAQGRTYSLKQLEAMPQTTVVATLQCGGNRRGELNSVRKTSGNAWGHGAISTAEFVGVRLRDVLYDAGVLPTGGTAGGGVVGGGAAGTAVEHIQFEGVDGTKASIPVDKAISLHGDVLLAYKMNGEALPADHGYPLRVVVPGHVGVRNIKWLSKIVASPEEAEGVWQRGMAYKAFGPDVTSLEGIDLAKYAPIQEMPVTSAILSPVKNAKCVDDAGSLEVRGLAWSGGGRGIVRVDVSADDGKTWHTATLGEGSEQPPHRAWAWTFWEAQVPTPTGAAAAGGTTLVCKAVDASHNTQPEQVAGVWNLRGLANNAWHRVPVRCADE